MKNLLSPIFEETQEILACYVYKRFDCGCRGAVSLAEEYYENEVAECEVCCSTVTMAWDGGVVRKVGVSSLPSCCRQATDSVVRSHVCQMAARPSDWLDGRTTWSFHLPDDALLVDAVRAEMTPLPTYAHHRAGALVNYRQYRRSPCEPYCRLAALELLHADPLRLKTRRFPPV